jgi:uncharacterized membrane protein YfcA
MFIFAHDVRWQPTLIMMAAGIAGGFAGPFFARRLEPAVIRMIVISVGIAMTCYFFYIAPK